MRHLLVNEQTEINGFVKNKSFCPTWNSDVSLGLNYVSLIYIVDTQIQNLEKKPSSGVLRKHLPIYPVVSHRKWMSWSSGWLIDVLCCNCCVWQLSQPICVKNKSDASFRRFNLANTFDLKGKVYGSDTEQSITSEMCLVSISILPKTSDGFAAIKK